jgi:hypothetical protein
LAPQSDGGSISYSPVWGTRFIVRKNLHRKPVLALLLLAPAVSGCSSLSNSFDLKDQEWFSRSGRLFIENVSISAPPLTPNKPLTPDDYVSAEGACPGMAPPGAPADANAMTEGPAGAPAPQPAPQGGTVALGHTECDVVRGIGAPDSVNISAGPGGGRVTVVTWLRGARAGIYTFNSGRLSSIERAPQAEPLPTAAKPKPKKKKQAAAQTG